MDVDRLTLHGRVHFFAVAAGLMRQILVDQPAGNVRTSAAAA